MILKKKYAKLLPECKKYFANGEKILNNVCNKAEPWFSSLKLSLLAYPEYFHLFNPDRKRH
jgi:hypothetical protein